MTNAEICPDDVNARQDGPVSEIESYLDALAAGDAAIIRNYYQRALELVPEAVPGRKYATRCTRPSRWWQSADRRESSECAVASLSVVVIEPGGKCVGAGLVAGEDLPVGPFGGEGAV